MTLCGIFSTHISGGDGVNICRPRPFSKLVAYKTDILSLSAGENMTCLDVIVSSDRATLQLGFRVTFFQMQLQPTPKCH